jgi:hypothetical protein
LALPPDLICRRPARRHPGYREAQRRTCGNAAPRPTLSGGGAVRVSCLSFGSPASLSTPLRTPGAGSGPAPMAPSLQIGYERLPFTSKPFRVILKAAFIIKPPPEPKERHDNIWPAWPETPARVIAPANTSLSRRITGRSFPRIFRPIHLFKSEARSRQRSPKRIALRAASMVPSRHCLTAR